MIHLGDCIEVMRGMEADSVDAVVTDPPYNLSFMGKSWDAFGVAAKQGGEYEASPWRPHAPNAKSVTGYMGSGRRGLTVDQSSKSNVPFQAWCEAWGTEALRVTKPGGYLLAFGGTRTHHRLVCGLEDAGWIIRDELTWIYASGFPKGKANLKPAHEPIVLARKPGPLRPLGIDASRIGTEPTMRSNHGGTGDPTQWRTGNGEDFDSGSSQGRWPSNVLLSSPALFDEPNPEVVGSGATTTDGVAVERNGGGGAIFRADRTMPPREDQGYGGSGGYSRFFIVPKSSRSDREPVITPDGHDRSKRFSTHPTQKPTDLMAHLIRLVCPPDGVILDPFLGSGSTAVAAEREGVKWIGIEQDAGYVAIAEARLNGTQRGLGLDVGAPTRKRTGRIKRILRPSDISTAGSRETDTGSIGLADRGRMARSRSHDLSVQAALHPPGDRGHE